MTKEFSNRNMLMGVFFSLLILLFSVFYICSSNIKPVAKIEERGSLNFGEINTEIVNLDGLWEFYPHVHINPDADFADYDDGKVYIEVPGDWKKALGQDGLSQGLGTYRIKILLDKEGSYGIKTRTLRLASRVFANGDEVLSTGNPSYDSFVPESKYKIAPINVRGREIELVIHMASFEYRTGGIFKSISFGSWESILKMDRGERSQNVFVIGISFILGLYFILTFLNRREDIYFGYFGLGCLFMALYLSTMDEQILDLIIDYNFKSRIQIQILAIAMTSLSIVLFTQNYFKRYMPMSGIKALIFLQLITAILPLLVYSSYAESLVKIFNGLVQPLTLVTVASSFGYVFYVLIRALRLKVRDTGFIMIMATSFSTYWVTLVFKIIYELDLKSLPLYLILITLITMALLMSNSHQRDYKEVRKLTNRLMFYGKQRDEFLARSYRELKKPISRISRVTGMLASGELGPLNKEQQEELFLISREGGWLSQQLEDILLASDFGVAKEALRCEALSAYEIVDSLLHEMRLVNDPSAKKPISNKIPFTLPLIWADRGRFTQIMYHLIENAIRYGGDELVEISSQLREKDVVFKVTDSGGYIDEKETKEFFGLFYRGSSKSSSPSGMGLGLPIVKRLVELHGGEVSLRTGPGFTEFSFNVFLYDPLKDSKTPEVPQKEKGGMEWKIANADKYTILVVEEDGESLSKLMSILLDSGLRAIAATSGSEALEIIDKVPVDLLIADLALEDYPSDILCKKIREDYSMTELPIVFTTLSGRGKDLIIALESGANDYVIKPISEETLLPKISSLLLMKSSVEESQLREFQYFYSQISPHFLYNTINSIIGLSYKDPELSRKALNNLSVYFRGKLDYSKGEKLIPLDRELELVEAYLAIEKLRFDEKLQIVWDVDRELEILVPPLSLQPLAENAIMHGIAKKEMGGKIWISAKKKSHNMVLIQIRDDGPGMDEEVKKAISEGESRGIGLRNVIEKFKILKGSSFEIDSSLEYGTCIRIYLHYGGVYEGDNS